MKLTINIDDKELDKLNLSKADLMLLLYFTYKDREIYLQESCTKLHTKNYLISNVSNPNIIDYNLNPGTMDILEQLITSNIKPKALDLKSLATKLKDMFPKGKKPGTSQYWTEGISLIETRLKLFIRKFGEFKEEDIIKATQNYLDEMENNPYMRTLKYFIFKNEIKNNIIEETSELYTYITHLNETETTNPFKSKMI
jgi:hypothetical protein